MRSWEAWWKDFKVNYIRGLNDAPEGINFRTGTIPADALCATLQEILRFLRSKDPSVVLYRTDDWYEHEGTSHGGWRRMSFDLLLKRTGNPSVLLEEMPGDFGVCMGIAPANEAWYLRIMADSEDGPPEGKIDVTVPHEWCDAFRAAIAPLHTEFTEQQSSEFYAGLADRHGG